MKFKCLFQSLKIPNANWFPHDNLKLGRNARKGPLARLLSTNAIKRRGSLNGSRFRATQVMSMHACCVNFTRPVQYLFIYLSDVCLFLMLNFVIFSADQQNIGSLMKR